MTTRTRTPSPSQRNALAPGLLAALVLFASPVLMQLGWPLIVLFPVSILALIVAWFAVQARHWWWVPVFLAIAIFWNPVAPFPFTGPVWVGAQIAAGIVFLLAGSLIRIPRV